MADDPKHSHLGASNADRWLNCPGSFSLNQGIPEPPSSKYALEGTKAHELAERLLRGGLGDPDAVCREYPPEMVPHILGYLARCQAELAEFDQEPARPNHRIEQRLAFDVDLQMFGTADFLATGYKSRTPYGVIVDLKYGTGKSVKAEANPQLAYYAASLWKQSRLGLKFVKVVVYQPRVKNGVTEVEYAEADLKLWARTLLACAEKAVWQHLMKKPELNPGRHCWWCKAKAFCPAQQRKRLADAAKDFEDISS